jgi:hypothetical protein
MTEEQIKAVFKNRSIPPDHALDAFETALSRHGMARAPFRLYGSEPLGLEEVRESLKRSRRNAFHMVGEDFDFRLGVVANYNLSFVLIKSTGFLNIPWDDFAAELISKDGFISAWVVDSEYDHWQNAKDPLEYDAVGKPYGHLPLKSNGLPYPLKGQIIDTSSNSGRWLFHNSYIEAVAAVMWLGEPFWKLTGARKEDVLSSAWLQASNPLPTVIKIRAAEHSFTSDQGEEADIQKRLRALLFPPQDPALMLEEVRPLNTLPF